MLIRMILAAAAAGFAGPALAACVEDATGARCDVFIEEYRAGEVPVGTPEVWPEMPFLLEDFSLPGVGDLATDLAGDLTSGGDVLYWDGNDAFVVPENSGPPIKIADW